MNMPLEFYVIVGICVAVMAFSAFYLKAESSTAQGLARVGVVVGGAALFVSVMYYMSILIAVMIIMIPIALIAAWWNGFF